MSRKSNGKVKLIVIKDEDLIDVASRACKKEPLVDNNTIQFASQVDCYRFVRQLKVLRRFKSYTEGGKYER
jgi:hypothetical protein